MSEYARFFAFVVFIIVLLTIFYNLKLEPNSRKPALFCPEQTVASTKTSSKETNKVQTSHHSKLVEDEDIVLNYDRKGYFSNKDKRTESIPFVTGDSFRFFAHYVFDDIENTIPRDYNLKPKAIIFVKTDFLEQFFDGFFENLKSKIILISHNSDLGVTDIYLKYLNDDRMIVWFAQNTLINHTKLIPIPIGFLNAHFSQKHNEKLLEIKNNGLKSWNDRNTLLYVNFDKNTNQYARANLFDEFQNIKGVRIMKERVTFSEYIRHINDSKFVLCPKGNGLDTKRLYETVLLGAIPVVESSFNNPIYENSTVLVLPKLNDLTQDMLINPQNYIKNMNFSKHIVYMNYWLKKLYSHI
ncbi:unnamed protein product [Brachionus calyciflorus]|uniref:Exostosin GT47 domain-containing protein n=1 Tax=Brachionus calyciflorus TaxID=104777 RepID=A0A814AGD0_9BILA|nr:unnamed protein product [Brachionus calyciflorus]